jgi:cytochrome P450
MNFLLAGYESSAVALCWTLYLLAEHPEVEAGLIAELDRTLTVSPGPDDVAHLRYTKSVILESMRLYPPVPLLGREAIRECSVGGLRVPRGALVVASQWVMHRDPRYFDRPDVFDPDRWSAGLLESLPRCVFFPFGGGPRGCIGSSFAMLELTLILATMARQIRLTRVAGHPVVPVASSSLFVKHGMPMTVSRRRPSEAAM